jgi:hypothetical protein
MARPIGAEDNRAREIIDQRVQNPGVARLNDNELVEEPKHGEVQIR